MKLLFMDHDGVLCLLNQFGSRDKKPNKYDADRFDKDCVQILNEIIIAEPTVEIVVSSDWRHRLSLTQMREMYSWQGVIKQPIGFTPNLFQDSKNLGLYRSKEIKYWLDQHNFDGNWCAVDDYDMAEWLNDNFVRCSRSNEGIKQTSIKEKIIKTLKN